MGGIGSEQQIYAHIVPVAGMVFEAYVNDNTTITTEAGYCSAIGENVEYIFAPDVNTKTARPMLNISTRATTSTLSWRILELSRRIDIDYSGTFVPLQVTCNKVQQSPYVLTGV